MFSHITVGSNDLARSKKFYDAVVGAMGGPAGFTDGHGRLVYVHRGAFLIVTKPIDGEAACHANGGTIGFGVEDPAEAEAWHKAGVENGGTPVEDAPGVREGEFGPLFLAYMRDPDGNKLCALHRMAS